jgi:hypothetical protein
MLIPPRPRAPARSPAVVSVYIDLTIYFTRATRAGAYGCDRRFLSAIYGCQNRAGKS